MTKDHPGWIVTEKDGMVCLAIMGRAEIILTPGQVSVLIHDLTMMARQARGKAEK